MEEKRKNNTMKQILLKNGVRGVTIPLKGMQTVTVEVFVKIGSKYERAKQFGLSHFLEHMTFKGTEKRPSAKIINNEIDQKGASYNAGTGHELTSYYIKTTKENLGWGIEILSDMLINSVYEKTEFEKEKGVIAEEIKMYQDNPMMGISSDFTEFLYGNSDIGCWNIAGSVESVESFKVEDLIGFRKNYFDPNNTIVVIAGDIVENEALSLIEQYFSVFANRKTISLPDVNIKLNDELKLVKHKETEQSHFCLGVPSFTAIDDRRYALKLLDIILSGNTSARLYQTIREEKALAYYLFSISESFTEAGYFGIQSGVKQKKLNEAIDLVIEELMKIGDDLTDDEIGRAKDYLFGKTKLSMDRTDFWSNYVGQKLLLENKLTTIEEELEKYRMVKKEDVVKIAKEIFVKNKIRTLVISR